MLIDTYVAYLDGVSQFKCACLYIVMYSIHSLIPTFSVQVKKVQSDRDLVFQENENQARKCQFHSYAHTHSSCLSCFMLSYDVEKIIFF